MTAKELVQRFDMECPDCDAYQVEKPEGRWVRYEDFAVVYQERERLMLLAHVYAAWYVKNWHATPPTDAWPKCPNCNEPIYMNHECKPKQPRMETYSALPERCDRCGGGHDVSAPCSDDENVEWQRLNRESAR